jgi:hypothetical protein
MHTETGSNGRQIRNELQVVELSDGDIYDDACMQLLLVLVIYAVIDKPKCVFEVRAKINI